MNRVSFAVFLVAVFVAAMIFTPVLKPLISGLFVRQYEGYTQTLLEDTARKVSYSIVYESHGDMIYALFTVPKGVQKAPAFVIVPATSITKETEQNHLGNALNELGYATFIIDPRGQGETGGTVPSLTLDFFSYKNGGYPIQFMMVDDVFRAYEIVAGRDEVNSSRIFVAGESSGGRQAVVAAALQMNFTGALIISSSGYDFNETGQDPDIVSFMRNINPFGYAGLITPRKVVFVHGTEDTVIPIAEGRRLFDAAAEPKKFYEVAGGHSFESITDRSFLKDAVEWLAG